MMVIFCAVLFSRDFSDGILDLIVRVSEGLHTYSFVHSGGHSFDPRFVELF